VILERNVPFAGIRQLTSPQRSRSCASKSQNVQKRLSSQCKVVCLSFFRSIHSSPSIHKSKVGDVHIIYILLICIIIYCTANVYIYIYNVYRYNGYIYIHNWNYVNARISVPTEAFNPTRPSIAKQHRTTGMLLSHAAPRYGSWHGCA